MGTVHENDLCIMCGICEEVCSQKAISFYFNNGKGIPKIDERKCIDCGLCTDICNMYHMKEDLEDKNINRFDCYNGFSNDMDIRKNGSSGGCITQVIKKLINDKIYDVAFVVYGYSCEEMYSTDLCDNQMQLQYSSKSRYVPISHRKMVEYVLKNREKKVIVVGTSCVLGSMTNVIDRFDLNRDQFLLLGLFCDYTLNYNIFKYFKDFIQEKNIKELFFRDKESIGWPGVIGVKSFQGEKKYYPSIIRGMAVRFFKMHSCLLCSDKLNQNADISFGDNYTGKNAVVGDDGSSSIVVRTNLGREIFSYIKEEMELYPITFKEIYESQYVDEKLNHIKWRKEKDDLEYIQQLNDIHKGENYTENASEIIKFVKRFTDFKENAYNKEIICFGTGKNFEKFIEMCGVRYNIVCAVDNDKNKWGKTKEGIQIVSPQKLEDINKEKQIVFITSDYFQEIGKQLENIGIDEYYIWINSPELYI